MEQDEMMRAVEAVLFTTGQAVSTADIARALETDTDTARAAAEALRDQYNNERRGMEIIALADSWQMCTRKEYYPCLIRLELAPKKPKLTDVMLETLSVIAYKMPVTKSEIERIRGVNSDHAVNKLIEFNLVTELGRAKLPGRPILFGTTEEFMRLFGVSSREDLPDIGTVELEDIRSEAEKEAETTISI